MNRHQMRESAFMLIFQQIFSNESVEEVIEITIENDLFPINQFSQDLFHGVIKYKRELDEMIEPHLNKWAIDRISKISLAILRLAVYEMKYEEDILDNVAISEAVKIAQMYTQKEDVMFINGILGSIARQQ